MYNHVGIIIYVYAWIVCIHVNISYVHVAVLDWNNGNRNAIPTNLLEQDLLSSSLTKQNNNNNNLQYMNVLLITIPVRDGIRKYSCLFMLFHWSITRIYFT